MATRNDITGDSIQTKNVSDAYRNNYDAIFGKSKQKSDFEKSQLEIVSDPVSASKEWTEEEKMALQTALKSVFPIENIPPLPEKGSGKHHDDSLYLQGKYKQVDCE
ncbi:MAG TPA: hypothetical protein VFM18_04430 [Methanosarcina sp.]|nr:hypothetical protein [Methanosarcina sp.]